MNKVFKKIIVVFCLGVLLCGIGCGVFFTEFSVLSYGGEYTLESMVEMKTEDFDVEFESEEEVGSWGVSRFNQYQVKIDESVPDNTVRFRTTYNTKHVEPYVWWNAEQEIIEYSYWYRNDGCEIAAMLEAKDIVLQNLREGKLVSFAMPNWEDVTVLANAESAKKVRIVN